MEDGVFQRCLAGGFRNASIAASPSGRTVRSISCNQSRITNLSAAPKGNEVGVRSVVGFRRIDHIRSDAACLAPQYFDALKHDTRKRAATAEVYALCLKLIDERQQPTRQLDRPRSLGRGWRPENALAAECAVVKRAVSLQILIVGNRAQPNVAGFRGTAVSEGHRSAAQVFE
jgi:hypothetical protein